MINYASNYSNAPRIPPGRPSGTVDQWHRGSVEVFVLFALFVCFVCLFVCLCVCVLVGLFCFVFLYISYEDKNSRSGLSTSIFGGPKVDNKSTFGVRNRRKSGLGAISGPVPFQDRSARCQPLVLDDFRMLFWSQNRTKIEENQRKINVVFWSQTKTVFKRSGAGFW